MALATAALLLTATVGPLAADAADAPVAVDDGYDVGKNGVLEVAAPGVLANDTVNGASLAVASSPSHGSLDLLSDGSFTYTPDLDHVGLDEFAYELTVASDDVALLADIYPNGPSRQAADPTPIATIGETIFFPARTPTDGLELWRTDGTTAGTQLVADIAPGTAWGLSGTNELVPFSERVWFAASTTAGGTRYLWSSDGSSAERFTAITATDPAQLTVSGSNLYLAASANGPTYLHVISDTGALTVHQQGRLPSGTSVAVAVAGEVVPFAGGVAFVGYSQQTGTEVWYGDAAGVSLLVDANPLTFSGFGADSDPRHLAVASGSLYFGTRQPSQVYYRYDDATETITQVLNLLPVAVAAWPHGLLFDDGQHLRGLDPADAPVELTPQEVTDSSMGVVVGDRVVFPATDATHGNELWVSDGAPAGAMLVADLYPGAGGSFASDLTVVADRVYLTADGGSGIHPWVTDGTASGTRELLAADPYLTSDIAAFGGTPSTVVFWAVDSSAGYEPWVHRVQRLTAQATVTISVTDPAAPFTLPVVEDVQVTDHITVLMELGVPVDESVTVQDLVAVLTELGVPAAETVNVGDIVSIMLELGIPIGESVTVADAVAIVLELDLDVGEIVTLTDTVTILAELGLPVGEAVTVTEIVSLLLERGIDIDESVTVVDVVDVLTELGLTSGEPVTVTDVVDILVELGIGPSEAITVADLVAVLVELGLSAGEPITVGDAVTVLAELGVDIGETVLVEDRVTLGAPTTGVFGPDGQPLTEAEPGATVRLASAGFTPGADVGVELRSDPIPLGSTRADLSGRVDVQVSLPPCPFGAGFSAGSHVLALVEGTTGHESTFPIEILDPCPAVLSVGDGGTVQHSDGAGPTTVSFADPDSSAAHLSISATGLPSGVTVGPVTCHTLDTGVHCRADVGGTVTDVAGTYAATVTVSDGTHQDQAELVIVVEPEDATLTFDPENPVAEAVILSGGVSGGFTIGVDVRETQPDVGDPRPGDISAADVGVALVPLGVGATVIGDCETVTGEAVLTATCGFSGVPVGTYVVQGVVDGGYFAGGSESLFTVFDPTLASTSGGGWFPWPETGERTTFGYTARYVKREVQGHLMLVQHHADGTTTRFASSSIAALASGDLDLEGRWASFTGTGSRDGVLGSEDRSFSVYVEDAGTGADRFWIEFRWPGGTTDVDSSMDRPPVQRSVALSSGNVLVHSRTGNSR